MKKNLSLIFILMVLFVNCSSTNGLNKPLGEFREASKTVVIKSKDYFLSMNRLEREFRFLEILADKNKNIDDTVTKAVFPPEGIQARLKALAIIDLYTARLVEIVSGEEDEKLSKNSEILSESLKNVAVVIGKITGDNTIKEYGNSLVPLVGIISSIWLEQDRKKALKQAILTAAPEVEKILILLETDLKAATEYRKDYLAQRYSELKVKYNQEKSQFSETERRAQIQELKFLYNSYDLLLSLAPEEVILSMRTAHTAFIQLSQNLKDKERLQLFKAAVINFTAKVNEANHVYLTFKNMFPEY